MTEDFDKKQDWIDTQAKAQADAWMAEYKKTGRINDLDWDDYEINFMLKQRKLSTVDDLVENEANRIVEALYEETSWG